MGGNAAFSGKLGEDEFGRMLAGILKDNGVDDVGITFDKGARTALAFVTLRADGEREFMFYRNPSADMLLTPDELNLDLIRKISDESSYDPSRSRNTRSTEYTSLSNYSRRSSARSLSTPHLRMSDHINNEQPIQNQNETIDQNMQDQGYDEDYVNEEREFRQAIITLAKKATDGPGPSQRQHHLPPFERFSKHRPLNYSGSNDPNVLNNWITAVDTTGVGDSFVGALLSKIVDHHAIIEDEPRLREVLKFANACGAITTTKKGAIPALPTEDEALEFIKNSS